MLACCRVRTGDWEAAEARAAAGPDEDAGSEDAFGEFEDLELGRKFGADGDPATVAAMAAIQDEARAAKAAKKATFDAEYDAGEGKLPGVGHVDASGQMLVFAGCCFC